MISYKFTRKNVILMFADDTIIYVKGGGSEEIEKILNRVLLIVEKIG